MRVLFLANAAGLASPWSLSFFFAVFVLFRSIFSFNYFFILSLFLLIFSLYYFTTQSRGSNGTAAVVVHTILFRFFGLCIVFVEVVALSSALNKNNLDDYDDTACVSVRSLVRSFGMIQQEE